MLKNSPKQGLGPANIPGSKKARLPDQVAPQLATLADRAPEGDGWLHEIKYDGYRVLARVENGCARLFTRHGNDWTDTFQSLAGAVSHLPVKEAWLDGEVVVMKPDGTTSFQDLQQALSAGADEFTYFLFDIMYLDGYDLREATLLSRKEILQSLLSRSGEGSGRVRFSDHVEGHGREFFGKACGYRLEGVISKSAAAPYTSGRTRSWLKARCYQRQEFVIGGYTEGKGARAGLGALLTGVYGPDGALRYTGRVGAGLGEELLLKLRERLGQIRVKDPPFAKPLSGPDARGKIHWVRPKLVAEVRFTGLTRDGMMRHPAFLGLREDKPASAVVMEENKNPPLSASSSSGRLKKSTSQPSGKAGKYLIGGVPLTNPDRILYPSDGLTKADLAGYYLSVADIMLPHLKDRPLTLVRCPEGYDKGCFYQKHADRNVPGELPRVPLKEDGRTFDYMTAGSAADILRLVQMGVLEVHTWGSRSGRDGHPDRIVFDIDPGPGVEWKRVSATAVLLKDRLEDLGLMSFLKTTGGKGLHVVAPIARRHGWEDITAFTKAVAEDLAKASPRELTASPAMGKRTSKIFIDYLRNMRGATAVEIYSTRAKSGAPVAAPISWEELSSGVRSGSFTVKNIPARLKSLKKDPWEGYFKVRQSITGKMRKKLRMP